MSSIEKDIFTQHIENLLPYLLVALLDHLEYYEMSVLRFDDLVHLVATEKHIADLILGHLAPEFQASLYGFRPHLLMDQLGEDFLPVIDDLVY